jgi:acetolactate synthase-1/2/3 large subunit
VASLRTLKSDTVIGSPRQPSSALDAAGSPWGTDRVETLEEFEDAFCAALASGRPVIIDAKISRWAGPHYSPSPDGLINAFVEAVEERFRD